MDSWCWSEEKGDRPSFDLVLERLEALPRPTASRRLRLRRRRRWRHLRHARLFVHRRRRLAAAVIAGVPRRHNRLRDPAASPPPPPPSPPPRRCLHRARRSLSSRARPRPRTLARRAAQVQIGHVRTASRRRRQAVPVFTTALGALRVAASGMSIDGTARVRLRWTPRIAKAAAYGKASIPLRAATPARQARASRGVRPLGHPGRGGHPGAHRGAGRLAALAAGRTVGVVAHHRAPASLQVRARRQRRRHATPHLAALSPTYVVPMGVSEICSAPRRPLSAATPASADTAPTAALRVELGVAPPPVVGGGRHVSTNVTRVSVRGSVPRRTAAAAA